MRAAWTITIVTTVLWAYALVAFDRAQASSCYAIRDMDKRLECLAIERRSPEGCTGAASKDMLVEQFQAFASEVLMHPVHELVGR